MSERNALDFLKAVQCTLRAKAGKALPPVIKRWRYTESSDAVAIELPTGTARFLIRYGLLDAGKEHAAQTHDFHALLQRLSRSSGDAPGVVAAWLRLFSDGEYAVLERGICASEPQCAICPLQETCRFLASGGRDARTFGSSLAKTLTSEPHSGDLRAADVLAFTMSGDKCGAADIARAEALLKACHGLRGLFQATPEALRELGLGNTALARLQATAELCRTWAAERVEAKRAFNCGQDFFNEYHLRVRELKKEVFIVVALDQKNGFLDEEQVSVGTLTETLVHPREVFAKAIACRAASIALIHNHPSGDPAPSSADKAITKRLDSVAKMVGIRLLDHIIIGDGRFVSFIESRLLS